ncbi:MAG TPA: hypothetical protein VJM32_06435 [Candidatus Saccharimonadales bacterium]|nr:hypothetical protein [Candidatus Saccharimonadales bacterium]
MSFDQRGLDGAIAAGEPQVVRLDGRNFLVLGKVAGADFQYVGFEVEATPRGTPQLTTLDHRVRQLDLRDGIVRPLQASITVPLELVRATVMPLYETVVAVATDRWRRGPSQSNEELLRLSRQAAESMVVSGLWTNAALLMEMWDQGIRWLGERKVEDLGNTPFSTTDLDALATQIYEKIKICDTPDSGA